MVKITSQIPSEGEIPFDIPQAGKPCYTWYKIVGELNPSTRKSNTTPLITLHGGPGACHEMLSPLADLNEKYGIPVIFYDQIGNGKSTHLREKAGDETFWIEELFVKELDNLIDYLGIRSGFDLYGQSWGGLLASRYATLQRKGLRKLIIADASASVECMQLSYLSLIPDGPELSFSLSHVVLPNEKKHMLIFCSGSQRRRDFASSITKGCERNS